MQTITIFESSSNAAPGQARYFLERRKADKDGAGRFGLLAQIAQHEALRLPDGRLLLLRKEDLVQLEAPPPPPTRREVTVNRKWMQRALPKLLAGEPLADKEYAAVLALQQQLE